MSWFQLDPQSLAQRARKSGVDAPSLAASLTRGVLGFTLTSIAGFAPWAVTGSWFYNTIGEVGLYAMCALVFIAFSGPALHRLIVGPGSMARFYKLFGAAFTAYAAAWILCWMTITGDAGCLTGLLAGTATMGWMLTRAFEAARFTIQVVAALFLLNALGYYGGAFVEARLLRMPDFTLLAFAFDITRRTMLAQLLWGAGYGIGFGAGLGLGFFLCQTQARALLLNGD